MTAPAGVVDLSLPDYPTLVARAGVDPRAEAARVAGADPGTVAGAGALLGRAGGEMDGAYTRSLGSVDVFWQATLIYCDRNFVLVPPRVLQQIGDS